MKKSEWKSRFESLPTGLTLGEIARQFGQTYRLTATWAKICGYNRASAHKLLWTAQRRREFQRLRWDTLDWSKTNAQLGREHGVSREIVRRRRAEMMRKEAAQWEN